MIEIIARTGIVLALMYVAISSLIDIKKLDYTITTVICWVIVIICTIILLIPQEDRTMETTPRIVHNVLRVYAAQLVGDRQARERKQIEKKKRSEKKKDPICMCGRSAPGGCMVGRGRLHIIV